jgi:ammonia channel protein AmtB
MALKYTIGLRVTKEEEIEGLDIPEMGSIGYIDAKDKFADGPAELNA